MTRDYINGDCMEGMKAYPDNHFDLAIVDPPYGIGNFTQSDRKYTYDWNNTIPDEEYFLELCRVSNNQIIWGANYYNSFSKNGGSIIWDKRNPHPNMSKCEIASVSWGARVNYVCITHYGFIGEKNRLHPCQKPVALYRWLLDNYAKPGDLILDTHVGSASSLIAFEEKGFEYVGYELDKDYYRDSCKRLETFRSQLRLFDTPAPKKEYKQMRIV